MNDSDKLNDLFIYFRNKIETVFESNYQLSFTICNHLPIRYTYKITSTFKNT